MTETQASCPRAALLAARAMLDDKLNSAGSSVGGLSEMPAQLVASSQAEPFGLCLVGNLLCS